MPGDTLRNTRVSPFDYERNGREVHVHGHTSHYHHGQPVYLVLYRPKDVVLPGGSKHDQRRASHRWHISGSHFHSQTEAERHRRSLMARGYTAIVEGVGGRSKMPSLKELLSDADRRDRELRAMRRE